MIYNLLNNLLNIDSSPFISTSRQPSGNQLDSRFTSWGNQHQQPSVQALPAKPQEFHSALEENSNAKQPASAEHVCFICSAPISQHFSQNRIYWYCSCCRQEFSHKFVEAAHQDRISRQPEQWRQFKNETPHLQIVRYFDSQGAQKERVVFPGEQLLLALESAKTIEIYSSEQMTNQDQTYSGASDCDSNATLF